jgi:translocation protein SEC72
MEDTYIQLPLQIDPASKAISVPASSDNKALATELTALNTLHRTLLNLDTPIPPPPPPPHPPTTPPRHKKPPHPPPVNPKRSAQIQKLRESGNASFRKSNYAEAIRMYTFGIEMAIGRPGWEPSSLVRDEVSALYANRAQAHMAMQNWPQAMLDAESSVEMKKVANTKAWWRKGRCLVEMGRLEEAKAWVESGLIVEADADLKALAKEIEKATRKKE